MEEKILLNYKFSYVCQIKPAQNIDGSIKEFFPEKKYKDVYKLNKHGNGPFCRFSISPKWSGVMGVYSLFFNNELKYIGQCIDFTKRFNLGYGQIQPGNCLVKGQSTNCKINKLIMDAVKNNIKVELYFYETNSYDEVESKLIKYYDPVFNEKGGKTILENSNKKKETKFYGNVKSTGVKLGVNDVYEYIEGVLQNAKSNHSKYIELTSRDIHKDLKLVRRMPTVCDAMYKLKKPTDIIIYSPPKGKGSSLCIRYYL